MNIRPNTLPKRQREAKDRVHEANMPKLREFTDQYDVVYVTPGGAAHLYESCWKNDNGLEKNTDVLFQDKEVCGYCAKRSSRVYR